LAIVFATVGLFLGKIAKMFRTEITLEKKFIDNAKFEFFITLIVSVGVLGTVKYWGMYSVLGFTAFGSALAVIFYLRLINYKYNFRIKKVELLKQIKIGFPLVLSTLAYGSYRYSEKLIILMYIGTVELGYYALGTRIMDTVLNIALTRVRVIKVGLSNMLGAKNYNSFHKKIVSETAITFFTLLILFPLFGFIIELVITKFLTDYVSAIPVLKIIVLSSCIRVIGASVTIAIQSPLVNKQKLYAPFQLFATIFLITSTSILHYYSCLNLMNFVILDIAGFVIWHGSLIVIYYMFFVNKHVVCTK